MQIPTGLVSKGYQVATTVVAPLVAAGMIASARGRIRLRERFGNWEQFEEPVSWWFHAASVGEVQGIVPLLRQLRERYPAEVSLLSCTSPTGLERSGNLVRYHRILPFDAPWCVRRALARVPQAELVLTETELWPELIRQVLERNMSCHLINARISDYTIGWYRRMRGLLAPLLTRVASVCVADVKQRERYIELGVPRERVFLTGHTKYDTDVVLPSQDERQALRKKFFPLINDQESILTLGSLRPGEEEYWFDAYRSARQASAPVRLVVAPRHAEKFNYFAGQLEKRGLEYRRFSELQQEGAGDPPVVLLDAMGVLQQVYSCSEVAFIGATLVDIGGHNPLEAAAYGVPVCLGPYTSVISEVVAELERVGGVRRVASRDDIVSLIDELVVAPQGLQRIGQNALAVVAHHRGASERVLSVLRNES